MKKNNALIFIANKSHLFALSSLIFNLQFSANIIYDGIIVYHDDLTESELSFLKKVDEKIEFIKYSYENWVEEHGEVESESAKYFLARYTHMAWCKYKIIEQLEFYKKILYLDLDIVVRGDISEIFNLNNVAWRDGFDFHRKFQEAFEGKLEEVDELNSLPKGTSAPNAGLLYFCDNFNYQQAKDQGRKFIIKYMNFFKAHIDELAISWMINYSGIEVHHLDKEIYNVLPEQSGGKAKIIHFMGASKAWSDPMMQIIFPEWLMFYKKYLAFGGGGSEKVLIKPAGKEVISGLIYMNRWREFFSDTGFVAPEGLMPKFDFSKSYFIMRSSDSSYYEILLGIRSKKVAVGLRLDGDFYLFDKKISSDIDDLVKSNPKYFKHEVSSRGHYLICKDIDEKNFNKVFKYFHSKTSRIFN